jgi:O-antigen/teichoic acid export membrane protein
LFVNIYNHLSARRFLRDVIVLSGGTASAQLILLLTSPLLTRIYLPADFGIRSVYISMLTILLGGITWRYHVAIPLPEKDEDGINLVTLSSMITLLMSLLTGLIWVVVYTASGSWSASETILYFGLLPISLAGGGLYLILSHWMMRKRAFVPIAKARITQPIGQLIPQIAVGVMSPGPFGLLLGDVVGRISSVLMLGRWFGRYCHRILTWVSLQRIWAVAERYRHLPIYSSWSVLVQGLSMQLLTLVLAWSFGSAVAGWYGIALLVLQSPFLLLSQAVSNVFLTDAASAYRSGRLGQLAFEVYARLVVLGMGPLLLIAVVAPDLFSFVFGAEWRMAGHYAVWIVPYVFSIFVSTHLTNLVLVLERQRVDLLFQLFLLTCRVALLIWCISQYRDPLVVIASYSMINAALLLAYSGWLLSIAKTSALMAMVTLGRELGWSALLVAPATLGYLFAAPGYALASAMLSTVLVGGRLVLTMRRDGGYQRNH